MDPKTQPADGEDAAENSSAAAEAIARDFDESIHLESPHSIGVDIVEIERMRAILERTPRFKTRIFSEDEQTYCNKKARPECHVEVVITAKGKPQVKLYRRAEEKAAELGIKDIPLSLSYTQDDAVACALALMNEPEEKVEKIDPLQDLHRQFKEVRSMLDEI